MAERVSIHSGKVEAHFFRHPSSRTQPLDLPGGQSP